MIINQIYKCNICGNIVEVVHVGGGTLVCCGQDMELLTEKTQDEGKEKHMPVIEQEGDEIIIKVGSVAHPMESSHYIEWIELMVGEQVFRQYLKSGDEPKAIFVISDNNQKVSVRIYCNIHGLWKSN